MNKAFAFMLCVAAVALLPSACCTTRTRSQPNQSDIIGAGDWSETVADAQGYKLRGRLLVCEGHHLSDSHGPAGRDVWEHSRVFLELEHVYFWGRYGPVQIFAPEEALNFELRDHRGKPALPGIYDAAGRAAEAPGLRPGPGWITVPCGATLRVRVDQQLLSASKPGVLTICTEHGNWILPQNLAGWQRPANPPGDYLLSATFSPSTNSPFFVAMSAIFTNFPPSNPGQHDWRGTLKLPPVKLTSKRP